MPILIEGGRVPKLLSQHELALPERPGEISSDSIRIALINNMPDPALEDTELQFFGLLKSASGNSPLSVRLYSLPELPRSEAGLRHSRDFYYGIDDLLNNRFDGVIMTGTEPHKQNLEEEPYWPVMAKVLDWAERCTTSTVLSCLAAHAGVFYSDGIPRRRLPHKQFGVFGYDRVARHALTDGNGEVIHIPHSRWNEVAADALTACGYEILTRSENAGIDLFVKAKGNSLFVHFQGHPEYRAETLLKEYRRDVKRFLRGEQETYPSLPHGYFDATSAKTLNDFRDRIISNPRGELLAQLPDIDVTRTQSVWQKSAAVIYRNWLRHLRSRKTSSSASSRLTPAARG